MMGFKSWVFGKTKAEIDQERTERFKAENHKKMQDEREADYRRMLLDLQRALCVPEFNDGSNLPAIVVKGLYELLQRVKLLEQQMADQSATDSTTASK